MKFTAVCFNCGIDLKINKPMEELIDSRLPVFCCKKCADEFPINGTKEFDDRLSLLKVVYSNRNEKGEYIGD